MYKPPPNIGQIYKLFVYAHIVVVTDYYNLHDI